MEECVFFFLGVLKQVVFFLNFLSPVASRSQDWRTYGVISEVKNQDIARGFVSLGLGLGRPMGRSSGTLHFPEDSPEP